jgi:hypothetical protein
MVEVGGVTAQSATLPNKELTERNRNTSDLPLRRR